MSKERSEYYQCTKSNGTTCVKCYTPSAAQDMLDRGVYTEMKMISVVKPAAKKERYERRRRRDEPAVKPYYQPYNLYTLSLEGLYE